MTTLRLYLRLGWPDNEAALPWSLIGAKGEALQHGDDEPARWPKAAACELILPAGRTLFTTVKLPESAKAGAAAVVGFALEEGLANDPAANLYVLGAAGKDGRRAVALTEAFAVRRAVQALKGLGRLCDRIVPEECLLPLPPEGGWSVARLADGWLLRQSAQRASWLPALGELAESLLFGRLAAAGAPQAIALFGGEAGELLHRLPGLPESACQPQPAFDWRRARVQGGFDFAQGDLAAQRRWRDWGPALKKTGLILGLLVAAQLALTLGQAGWYAWKKQSLQADIRELSKPWLGLQAMPGATSLPMTRLVDKLRLSHGLAARDDVSELMGALALAAGPQLQACMMEYEAGRLHMVIADVPGETIARWKAKLADKNIRLESRAGPAGLKDITLTREP